MLDDVEWRVRVVRRDAGDWPASYRVVRQLLQHALRVAERAGAVVDRRRRPPQRQRRLHHLPPADLSPGRHRARPRLPLDQDLLHLRRQRRYKRPPTIRYEMLFYKTCAQKPTGVGFIYRTKPTSKKWKTEKVKNGHAQK